MDPTRPGWLKAAQARRERERDAEALGSLRLRRPSRPASRPPRSATAPPHGPPRPARRSRRPFLAGLGLAGAAVAGGAYLGSRVGQALPGLSSVPGLEALAGRVAPPAATATPSRPPLAAPLTYVALGASDATGLGARDPAREGWVPLLAQGLPRGTRLVNLGVPGITLREAVERVLPRALGAQPGLVTVWLVVNDILAGVSLESYRADLDRLLGELRRGAGAEVAVGNLPDPPGTLGGVQLPAIVRRTIVGQWNEAIAGAARKHDAILVDLYRRWPVGAHPEYIGPDGLHPTASGYQSLAQAYLDTLRDARLLS
jgi:acyl-CoA thioesterase-1